MVEGNSTNESGNTNDDVIADITARMKHVDSKIPSPSDRAELIFAKIKEVMPGLSVWDTICFSAEYIGSQIGTLPFLEDNAKQLNMLIYAFHYQYPKTVDPSYPDDESDSSSSTTQTSVADVGNNKRDESHG